MKRKMKKKNIAVLLGIAALVVAVIAIAPTYAEMKSQEAIVKESVILLNQQMYEEGMEVCAEAKYGKSICSSILVYNKLNYNDTLTKEECDGLIAEEEFPFLYSKKRISNMKGYFEALYEECLENI